MNALQLRSAAAIELVRDRVLDCELALSLVVWPPPKLHAATEQTDEHRGKWTDEDRRLAFELAAQGVPQRQIAIQVCGAASRRSTVQGWLRERHMAAA